MSQRRAWRHRVCAEEGGRQSDCNEESEKTKFNSDVSSCFYSKLFLGSEGKFCLIHLPLWFIYGVWLSIGAHFFKDVATFRWWITQHQSSCYAEFPAQFQVQSDRSSQKVDSDLCVRVCVCVCVCVRQRKWFHQRARVTPLLCQCLMRQEPTVCLSVCVPKCCGHPKVSINSTYSSIPYVGVHWATKTDYITSRSYCASIWPWLQKKKKRQKPHLLVFSYQSRTKSHQVATNASLCWQELVLTSFNQ